MYGTSYYQFYRSYLLSNCSDKKKVLGFSEAILGRINDFLCCCREYYSKVYFVQFILKFPCDYSNEEIEERGIFGKFLEALVRRYRRPKKRKKKKARLYKGTELSVKKVRRYRKVKRYRRTRRSKKKIALPLYLWVKEYSEKSHRVHYHLVMAFNGQRKQSPKEIQAYAENLWNSYFPDTNAPIDFGYVRGTGRFQYSELFQYGGCMIKHNWDHDTVVGLYRNLFTVLSYYAKQYSKLYDPTRDRRSKNYSCSLKIPRYQELVEDVDVRIRKRKEGFVQRPARFGGNGQALESQVHDLNGMYQKKIMRSVPLIGKTASGRTANNRQAEQVTCWTTACGTYQFYFGDGERLREKYNGPDILLIEGSGVGNAFVNVSKTHSKHSEKQAHYEGLIYGEQVEVKLSPISGELRYIKYVPMAEAVQNSLKENGYYGGG